MAKQQTQSRLWRMMDWHEIQRQVETMERKTTIIQTMMDLFPVVGIPREDVQAIHHTCLSDADVRAVYASQRQASCVAVVMSHVGRQRLYIGLADRRLFSLPFAALAPSGTCRPDFTQPRLLDQGQTIALGAYQAATDAVLADPACRPEMPHTV